MEVHMSDIEEKVDRLQADLVALKIDVAVLKTDVRDLKREMTENAREVRQDLKDVRKHQGQDFRLLATAILVVAWMMVFGLMVKGFGW